MLTQLLFCTLFLAVAYGVGLAEQSSQDSELAIGSGSVGVVTVTLARELIQATIDLAQESAGVGGPIDIATLTKTGFHCIQRKSRYAKLPSPHTKVTNSKFGASPQDLDNLQCIRCDFTDSHLLYAGTADVQLMDTTFGGGCRLAITPHAYRRRPEIVDVTEISR